MVLLFWLFCIYCSVFSGILGLVYTGTMYHSRYIRDSTCDKFILNSFRTRRDGEKLNVTIR